MSHYLGEPLPKSPPPFGPIERLRHVMANEPAPDPIALAGQYPPIAGAVATQAVSSLPLLERDIADDVIQKAANGAATRPDAVAVSIGRWAKATDQKIYKVNADGSETEVVYPT
jgi:hypothetical protein